jgi:hypothetical protein
MRAGLCFGRGQDPQNKKERKKERNMNSFFITLLVVLLVSLGNAVRLGSPCNGCTDVCSLVPPANSSFPCYQGTPSDASKCFKTDPLLASGTTWTCETCSAVGYPVYLRNDPIYTSMELWSTN